MAGSFFISEARQERASHETCEYIPSIVCIDTFPVFSLYFDGSRYVLLLQSHGISMRLLSCLSDSKLWYRT